MTSERGMKKLLGFSVVVVCTLILSGCMDEGDKGAQGPAGADGVQGPVGPAGDLGVLAPTDGTAPNNAGDANGQIHWDRLTGMPADFADGVDDGTVTQVNTGDGLTGGPFTSTGTISIMSGVVDGDILSWNFSATQWELSQQVPDALTLGGQTSADLDTKYVFVAGDTMTGLLTLSGDPTVNLHAATKQYVDTAAYVPPDADLSDLTISAGTLSPAFSRGNTFYLVRGSLPFTVTVTPTATDPAATITVNGAAVASATASAPISLEPAMNHISIIVTAADGVTQKGYSVLVFQVSQFLGEQYAYGKASNTGAGDQFGRSVAISGDTIVVGAIFEDSSAVGVNGNGADNTAVNSGAAYVFVRTGGVWSQQAYLKASNTEAGDRFGWSVAISGDTIVVGADAEDSSAVGVNGNQADNTAVNSGAAYVFVRGGGVWTQQAYLKASNTAGGDNIGSSVAISGDTIVVGAQYEDSSAVGVNGNEADNAAIDSGAAYVFVRAGGVWSQQSYLKASNTGANDQFGNSVAISSDTIVVGAYLEDSIAVGVNGNEADNTAGDSGAAYVFVRTGGVWSQEAYLKASNTDASDVFGFRVAISGDTIVVGARFEDSSAVGVNGDQADNTVGDSGSAYVFVRTGGVWSQQAYLKASNTDANDWFGWSVSISGDTIVVGARLEDSSAAGVNGNGADNTASASGAAYVFVRGGGVWSQQAYLKASNTDAGDEFGSGVAISGDTIVVGAYWEDSSAGGVNGNGADNTAADSGAIYVFE